MLVSTKDFQKSPKIFFFRKFYNKEKDCVGMKTSVYLLEKIRVLSKEGIGRFHVFNKERDEIKKILEKSGFQEDNINFIFSIVDTIKEIINLLIKYSKHLDLSNIEKNENNRGAA